MNTAEELNRIPDIDPATAPAEIYRLGRELAPGPLVLACSFSIDDVTLIDLLGDHLADIKVFAIDTGRLNEETYEVAESITQRYGIGIDWYFPRNDAVETLERSKGLFSFRESVENRHECCHIRKVEPLQRALQGKAGWITGLRRGQSVTRSDQRPIEIDRLNGGLLKISPLTFWSDRDISDHAEARRLPVNRLHQRGYPSIGCAPCTRAVRPGEPARAGRWWWENSAGKECGLHRR